MRKITSHATGFVQVVCGCGALGLTIVLLAACSGSGKVGPSLSQRVVSKGQVVPKGGGHYKVGKPYKIAGQTFTPRENRYYDKVGIASWYGDLFHGRRTANGEVFDMDALTAAHPTLPLPVYAQVTNLQNGRNIVVRINDRGPYKHNRVIDLSRRSAQLLGFQRKGTARVRVKFLGRAPMNGDDSYEKRYLAGMSWYRNAQQYARRPSNGRPSQNWRGYNRPFTVGSGPPEQP